MVVGCRKKGVTTQDGQTVLTTRGGLALDVGVSHQLNARSVHAIDPKIEQALAGVFPGGNNISHRSAHLDAYTRGANNAS